MEKKSLESVFEEKLKKHKESKRALIELIEENKHWLHLKITRLNHALGLMHEIGEDWFYKETEDPIYKVIHKGDIYKKVIESKPVSEVKKIKGISNLETRNVLKALESSLEKREVNRIMIPQEHFIFRFQVRSDKGEIIKMGRSKTLVFKAESLEQAIGKMKEAVKEMKYKYFKDFMVFQPNVGRWRILGTKQKGGWLTQGYVIATELRVII
ncbi:MAG: hypothetical protein GF370_00885 [Candidatus Nealsonbacteria bacterium]|nr:hypothetical protein [Candidatus Nealsonbacteria bacterium]